VSVADWANAGLRLLLAGLLLYLAVVALAFLFQRSLLFPAPRGDISPAEAGLMGVEEVTITTADGERLVGWYSPPRDRRPVLWVLHGNGDRPSHFAEPMRAITDAGLGFLVVAYRGYGRSSGSPSEAGLHADALAMHAFLAERVGAARVVVHGFSLGAAVAVRLATERPVAGLILEAPFTSAVAAAKMHYPLLPVAALMRDRFPSIDRIGGVRVPLLVLHGARDGVVPLAQGEALYAAAAEPKEMVVFPTGQHTNLWALGAAEHVQRFILQVAATTRPAVPR
jgi:hypothetical protein